MKTLPKERSYRIECCHFQFRHWNTQRLVAVAGDERIPITPDVPLAAVDQGYPVLPGAEEIVAAAVAEGRLERRENGRIVLLPTSNIGPSNRQR